MVVMAVTADQDSVLIRAVLAVTAVTAEKELAVVTGEPVETVGIWSSGVTTFPGTKETWLGVAVMCPGQAAPAAPVALEGRAVGR
jgi:hypothetical protein